MLAVISVQWDSRRFLLLSVGFLCSVYSTKYIILVVDLGGAWRGRVRACM